MVGPLGCGVEQVWTKICNGSSGIGPITKFDVTGLETKIAGEVTDFNPEAVVEAKELRKMDAFIQYAMVATEEAVRDSGLELTNELSHRVGVIVGTGLGGLNSIERYHKILLDKGPRRISPFFIPMLIPNEAAAHISIRHNARGPNKCVATACATGAHALGDALRCIQHDDADVVISGGAEATTTPLSVAGFNAMKAISTRNDEPERASRPFDRERDGFVMGEGAAIMILEELEHARKRGARIYAELAGYGWNGDAFHLAAPDPDGDGARRCMELGLHDAHVSPEQIDYINAHGTSTELNDITETMAIKELFGSRASQLPVSSTKSMTGHLLGAAGSTEAVFSVLAIRDSVIPPTINYEYPDPQCDLDYVPNVAREVELEVTMSNSFGFGGTNAVLVFRKLR
jgi:3-oxoacyl-[acyl-carrier-protein] synthase II